MIVISLIVRLVCAAGVCTVAWEFRHWLELVP